MMTAYPPTSETAAYKHRYIPYSIGLYNVENLFDTIDNPFIKDDEFTPNGDMVWTGEKYNEKVANIASVEKLTKDALFNLMHNLFDKGLGSLAYRDRWSLFDLVLLSPGFVKDETGGLKFQKAHIYSERYLIDIKGDYKGYPLRTFSGDVYKSGYSAHFRVYIYLPKEKTH